MNIGFIKGIRQTIAKRAANKSAYKEYRTIIKDWEKRLNQVSCLKIEIAKTPRSIVSKNGFAKETLETLQTSEFLEKFHRFFFNLAAQGFKFSLEITARYIKSGGPKIETIITKEDMAYLEKLRRQIAKKSLSDYGYTMSV